MHGTCGLINPWHHLRKMSSWVGNPGRPPYVIPRGVSRIEKKIKSAFKKHVPTYKKEESSTIHGMMVTKFELVESYPAGNNKVRHSYNVHFSSHMSSQASRSVVFSCRRPGCFSSIHILRTLPCSALDAGIFSVDVTQETSYGIDPRPNRRQQTYCKPLSV